MIIFGVSKFSKLMKWYVENDTEHRVSAFTVEGTIFLWCSGYPFRRIRKTV